MQTHSNLVDLARQHRWQLEGRAQYGNQITIAMRDRRVLLSTHRPQDGEHAVAIRVETPPPGLPKFRISREGFVSFIAGALGGQDIEIGVPLFDYEYRVRSPEPDELRRVWTPERCELARARLTGMLAHATHEHLFVEVRREDFSPPSLDDAAIVDALQLATDLAHADVYGIAALRALPEAVFGQHDGPHVELAGPAPIVIRPVRERDRVFTQAAMQGALLPPAPDTSALGAVQLACDGELVTVSWAAIEEDRQRLCAAIELLRTLTSAPSGGAYR